MQNLPAMWVMYNQATTWGVRPSSLAGIEDSYRAYCFDEVVHAWGTFVENEIQSIEGDNPKRVAADRERRLNVLLGLGEKKGQFADPASLFAQ